MIRDDDGDARETFPMSMLLCAGTQADTALSNRSVHFNYRYKLYTLGKVFKSLVMDNI